MFSREGSCHIMQIFLEMPTLEMEHVLQHHRISETRDEAEGSCTVVPQFGIVKPSIPGDFPLPCLTTGG